MMKNIKPGFSTLLPWDLKTRGTDATILMLMLLAVSWIIKFFVSGLGVSYLLTIYMKQQQWSNKIPDPTYM